MVHFSQSLLSDVPLATSLPTTFTFNPNNQHDDPTGLQQTSMNSSSPSASSSHQPQRASPSNEDRNGHSNHQGHVNDYETRLRCPNCETWVVNLSDHLRKTHRIASPVDRKPLLRMARLEKRRMTESANHTSPSTASTTVSAAINLKQAPTSLLVNGLPSGHTSGNEIENLLFKQEHEPSTQTFSVTLPENILINQQLTHPMGLYATSGKRSHPLDDQIETTTNGLLGVPKKARIELMDATKSSQQIHGLSNKSNKKNRNKQQNNIAKQVQPNVFPTTIVQPTVAVQNIGDTSSDDLNKVLQMMGNEMNFLNQHLQTTTVLLQKQLDLARDSLHACSAQFAHLKRMIQQQI